MDMTLLIPEGESLVTYFMLPLIGLNKLSFGRHFKTSYVAEEGDRIYVELKSNMVSPTYKNNINYTTQMVVNGKLLILFTIPKEYAPDLRLFVLGLYSQMSKRAKKIIYATSTLPFNKKMGSFNMSHPVLQALDKTKTLRNFLLTDLKVTSLALNDELINKPKPEWFIENRLK